MPARRQAVFIRSAKLCNVGNIKVLDYKLSLLCLAIALELPLVFVLIPAGDSFVSLKLLALSKSFK